MAKKFIIVIPARYKSSRFPGKPLIDLLGKSMIQRTYEQCCKAVDKNLVYVATEDECILRHCEERGMQCVLTSDNCLTGTDRVFEVSKLIDAGHYINVQGDEPLFNPADIQKVIEVSEQHPEDIINGYCPLSNEQQYRSLSVPKVVFNSNKKLLYMSRSPIPGNKENAFRKGWRQVCIYSFPKRQLALFGHHTEKTPLEREEDIEILRFLELGVEVSMVELSQDSVPIDNPEDVGHVVKILKNAQDK